MKNPIKAFFEKRKAKKERLQQKTESVISGYEDLINELRLIEEKKSTLSRKQRDFVVLRVKHLIYKGHIQVNS